MRPKSPNYYQKNIMVKRILLSIVLLLVIAYLVVAVTAFNRKPTSQVCQDVELVIKDTVYAGFIPDLPSYQKRSFFYNNTFLFKINPQDTAVREALSHRNQYQDHHLPYLRFPMKPS